MPYKRVGKCVYKKTTGKKVGCSKSAGAAKKYIKKLHMVSHESVGFDVLVNQYLGKYFLENSGTTTDNYYQSLNNYLKQHAGLYLGKNTFNPETGMINPDQKGIYDITTNKQVGKIERYVTGNALILEHIKFYTRRSGKARFVYNHDEEFARKHNLIVKGQLVNDITEHLFNTTYTQSRGWNVSFKGKRYTAVYGS